MINLLHLAFRIPFRATQHDGITIRIKPLQRFTGRNGPDRIDPCKIDSSASSIEPDKLIVTSILIRSPSRPNDWQHDLSRESISLPRRKSLMVN
jgi:hypothetical protein